MSKIKTALEKSNTPTATLPAKHYDNPWLEAAAEGGNNLGKILKFVKGEWQTGDDTVPEGTEYVARIDHLARGWVRFEDNKVVDQIIGKVADGFKPQPRNELSNTDPKAWKEKDPDGNPRDPWTQQWYLPLVGVETGNVITFISGSKGGIGAIADLCRIYGHKKRDGMLPIVALKVRSYKHRQYGRIETPELAIVGWDGLPIAEAAAIPVRPTHTEKATANADLNDEIPF